MYMAPNTMQKGFVELGGIRELLKQKSTCPETRDFQLVVSFVICAM